MKKLFTLILLLALCVVGGARERSLSEMQTAAKQVIKAPLRNTMSTGSSVMKILKTTSQLTILGYDGAGYAVIANDDAFTPVMGYSDQPLSTDESKQAPGFKSWLSAMNNALKEKLLTGERSVTFVHDSSFKTAVAPLLKSTWGQGDPYNRLCPAIKGEKVPSGCVATAMAQIMYYYKLPTKGIGSFSYTWKTEDTTATLSANFGTTTYDWANMKPYYSAGTFSQVQANAVATLMYHCGVSVSMGYNKGGSGALQENATTAFGKYFNYNHTNVLWRQCTNIDEWMYTIFNELNDGCPVFYGGFTPDWSGHQFVLDGYDAAGNVHINWGWDGNMGYYNISEMNGFSESENMTLVRPKTDSSFTQPADHSYCGLYGDLTLSLASNLITYGGGPLSNFERLRQFTGQVALAICNLSTKQIVRLSTPTTVSNLGYNARTGISGNLNISTLPDGKYRVYLVTKASWDGNNWQPVRSNEKYRNSAILEKSGSNVKLTSEPNSYWTCDPAEWANRRPTKGNGSKENPYYIYTAENLQWFRDYVGTGDFDNTAAYATLMADIDMSQICGATIGTWKPIGTEKKPFKGSFDGNLHVINNLYVNNSDQYQGLFGVVDGGAVIKNLYVNGNVKGGNYIGGLIGAVKLDTTTAGVVNISKCYMNVKVAGGINAAGLLGVNFNNSTKGKVTVRITDCASLGDVTATKEGALLSGWLEAKDSVRNSFVAGKLIGGQTNCSFARSATKQIFANCYSNNFASVLPNVKNVTVAAMKSGLITWKLNGETDKNDPAWGQTIGKDIYPILGGEIVSLVDGTYANVSKTLQGDGSHDHPYQINNATELGYFRNIVNHNQPDACAQLKADIDMAQECCDTIGSWKPIGSILHPFCGTFDGGLFNITNIYINTTEPNQGLFGVLGGGALITKTKLMSGTISGGSATASIAGSICYQDTLGTVRLDRCFNAINISGGLYSAGIFGYNQNDGGNVNLILTHCGNVGNVKAASKGALMAGWLESNDSIIFSYTEGSLTGGIWGHSFAGGSTPNFTKCYTTNLSTQQSGVSNVNVKSMKIGQITWLLNDSTDKGNLVWGQKIGIDMYPVLSGDVVSLINGEYVNNTTYIRPIVIETSTQNPSNIYDLQGHLILKNFEYQNIKNLPKGIYIIKSKKVFLN